VFDVRRICLAPPLLWAAQLLVEQQGSSLGAAVIYDGTRWR
jgi:hypothetical protein